VLDVDGASDADIVDDDVQPTERGERGADSRPDRRYDVRRLENDACRRDDIARFRR
jgi:hypothetical protein